MSVVPTGPYIPQMIQKGPAREVRQEQACRTSSTVDTPYLGPGLGPDERLQRLQRTGVRPAGCGTPPRSRVDIATWTDFINACMG